ncbi:hypothetical protein AB0K16_25810 [Nonomuraea jabiensis]|uniref:hypothetical protein n=1 Tax=Nonomuraea jabiensis TaxID=882448 RepID=UPI003418F794
MPALSQADRRALDGAQLKLSTSILSPENPRPRWPGRLRLAAEGETVEGVTLIGPTLTVRGSSAPMRAPRA